MGSVIPEFIASTSNETIIRITFTHSIIVLKYKSLNQLYKLNYREHFMQIFIWLYYGFDSIQVFQDQRTDVDRLRYKALRKPLI